MLLIGAASSLIMPMVYCDGYRVVCDGYSARERRSYAWEVVGR